MEYIKYFEKQDEFLENKSELPFPCVSYVEETKEVEYKTQSMITAKFKITQNFLDDYENDTHDLFTGDGLLESYSINGIKYGPFEEPKYETISNETNYIDNELNCFYLPTEESKIKCGELTPSLTLWANSSIDINKTRLIASFNTNNELYINHYYLNSDSVLFDEINNSFSLSQSTCDEINGYSYEYVSLTFSTDVSINGQFLLQSKPNIETYFNHLGETKKVEYIKLCEKAVYFENKIEEYLPSMTITLDKPIENADDAYETYFILTLHQELDSVFYTDCTKLSNYLTNGFIELLDNKTIRFSPYLCEELNNYISLYGLIPYFSICSSDEFYVSPTGSRIFACPSSKNIIIYDKMLNKDKIFYNVNIETSDIKLNDEYNVELYFNSKANSIGAYSALLYNIDLSNLDEKTNYIIPDYAFQYTSISSINLGNNIISLGSYSFNNCINLTELYIPSSIKKIDNSAFYKNSLNKIYIDSIENWCAIEFYGVDSNPLKNYTELYVNNELVEDIIISNDVSSYTFSGYKYLKTLIFTDDVKEIGRYAFSGCSNLNYVEFSNSGHKVNYYAFSSCKNLKDIKFNNLDAMSWETFDSPYPRIFSDLAYHEKGNVYYPYGSSRVNVELLYRMGIPTYWNTIQFMPQYRLDYGYSIKIVYDISDTTISTILNNKFYDIYEMKIDGNEITPTTSYTFDTIGEHEVKYFLTVTSIGSDMFSGIDNIISIDISGDVNYIDLESVNTQYLTVSSDNKKYDSRENCNAIIITETNELKYGTSNTIIPNTVTKIVDKAFINCSDLTEIVIPDSVTEIGYSAFTNCSNLSSVTIGNSVQSIGNDAFTNCSNLECVNINSLENWCNIYFVYLNNNPLYGRPADLYLNGELVTDLTIGDSISYITWGAFASCKSLKSLTILNTIEIDDYAFHYCSNLSTITCKSNIAPIINSSAFSNISETGTLYYPKGSDYSSVIEKLPEDWTIVETE